MTKNVTDTGSMQTEATSVIEQVERKKNGIEKDGTERRRKPDTSHLEGLFFNKTVKYFEAEREIYLTSGSKSKDFPITSRAYVFLIRRLRIMFKKLIPYKLQHRFLNLTRLCLIPVNQN